MFAAKMSALAKIRHLLPVFTFAALAVLVLVNASPAANGGQQRESRQDESCHLRELDLCLASVAVFTQSSNAHPINNNEINRQCKLLVETESCLANFTRRCFTDQQEEFFDMVAEGGLSTIRDLCKPQSKLRDSYLKHGNCINNQHREQRVCMRDFQASLEKAADIEWQDRLKLGCCSFNRLTACVKDIIEPKCGAEAYELSRTFFRASFSRVPQITCSKYDYNSKQCAAILPPAGTVPKGAKSHSVLSKLFSAYTGS